MESKKETVDVFLCHNGADKDWVRELGEQIESETFDGSVSGRQLRVFFDEWDIDVGRNVPMRLNQALTVCRYVAVVISPEMLNAPWATLEWTHIVSDDPTNRKGRIIPIFLRDYTAKTDTHAELPAPFKALKWIDFRRPADFKRSFQTLIRKVRDQPPSRGRRRRPIASATTEPRPLHTPSDEMAAAPDRVPDLLLGNLLPVEDYPSTIWFGPTDARKSKDVCDAVESPAPFVLQREMLFTFADLSRESEPLRAVITDTRVESVPVGEWRNDPVRWRWCVSLLNRCLRSHLGGLPIKKDKKGRYFFRPKDDGKRVWQNGNDPERTVADKKTKPGGEVFWVHHGSRLAFQTLGDRLFLCVQPCYVFTSDGNEPLEGKPVGPLSIKWGGKERNAAILRHVVFWGRTLTKQSSKIRIDTGGTPVVLSAIPAFARTSFGIEFDQIGVGALIGQVEDELDLAAEALIASTYETGAEPNDDEEEDDG